MDGLQGNKVPFPAGRCASSQLFVSSQSGSHGVNRRIIDYRIRVSKVIVSLSYLNGEGRAGEGRARGGTSAGSRKIETEGSRRRQAVSPGRAKGRSEKERPGDQGGIRGRGRNSQQTAGAQRWRANDDIEQACERWKEVYIKLGSELGGGNRCDGDAEGRGESSRE